MEISLSNIRKNAIYKVCGFAKESSEYAEKLRKMGFTKGTRIQLSAVKIHDPLVFQIRGSRIALRRKEAHEILVQEI